MPRVAPGVQKALLLNDLLNDFYRHRALHENRTCKDKDQRPEDQNRLPAGEFAGALFIPKRHHRIDLHGAPCRDEAGSERDSDEQESNRCERWRIGGSYTVKQSGQNARGCQRDTNAGSDADERKR